MASDVVVMVQTVRDGIILPNKMTNQSFHNLLKTGLISELAVVDMLNHHSESFFSLFMMNGLKNAHLPKSKATPYDVVLEIGNDIRTIEVKSANCGNRYPTFFAEIIQTATMGYAEYLVYVPNYIVYVDIPTGRHYWYNGDMFVAAVKSMYMHRIKAPNAKAEGVKFLKDSTIHGYIGCVEQIPTRDDIEEQYMYVIHQRMSEPKIPEIYKRAPFLPDL
jgi:hypothetical protein